MEIDTKNERDALVVSVTGRMGEVSAPEFEEKMMHCIGEGEKTIVVDLERLEYISSAGLRSILATAKALKDVGGKIYLAGLTGAVKEVFEISQFVSIFEVYDSVEAALAAR
jgi:anti-anti-sigma factor